MQYLLKVVSGAVQAIIELPDSESTPSGYITLTKAEYDLGVSSQNKDTFLLWDSENRTFSTDQSLVNIKTAINTEKSTVLAELRALSVDIDLYGKLGDSDKVTALQSEFDALKENVFGS